MTFSLSVNEISKSEQNIWFFLYFLIKMIKSEENLTFSQISYWESLNLQKIYTFSYF